MLPSQSGLRPADFGLRGRWPQVKVKGLQMVMASRFQTVHLTLTSWAISHPTLISNPSSPSLISCQKPQTSPSRESLSGVCHQSVSFLVMIVHSEPSSDIWGLLSEADESERYWNFGELNGIWRNASSCCEVDMVGVNEVCTHSG
jgi:hypothetical protein